MTFADLQNLSDLSSLQVTAELWSVVHPIYSVHPVLQRPLFSPTEVAIHTRELQNGKQ